LALTLNRKERGSFEIDFLFFVELTEKFGQGRVEFGKMKFNKIYTPPYT